MSDTTTVKPAGFMERMYNGEGGFAIVDSRRRWYWIYALVTVACILIIAVKGFALGVDFEGGTKMSMPPTNGATESSVSEIFEEATGVAPQSTQTVGSGDSRVIEVTSERLSDDQIRDARVALFDEFAPEDNTGTPSPDAISDSTVSESWGQSITQRMLLGMVIFLAVVFLYITVRLERDMAISAIVSLLLDGVVVAGVYSLVGFEVSPATVIGLLTILAYSLYDTVIVFDKVHENTQDVLSSTRSTYGEQVNLAVNQTIMRSLNTSLFSVIPIAALLVVAVWLMGVGTLKDLALVQLVGVVAGTVSSIYFSAPLLVTLKARQRRYRDHDAKVTRARELAADPSAATAAEEPDTAVGASAADLLPLDGAGTAAGSPSVEAGQSAVTTAEPTADSTDAEDPEAAADTPRRTVYRPDHSGHGDRGRSWRPGM
ncbi:protein translocase subunit SecF [Corynebacterium terpenotabidum]|uniref:Protein translocase subunit SecF n=1 Tax=Corynebacterium terpenotabidum Y-11 TaxID=1200352 RepID=S4XE81_9CORY|nr:protein translocase subunit SecF [Corynebacterium terpenotabidum]AGP30869.1 protein-export membrane protein [Corynebacterium terpenotabidum Y-11]